MRPGPGLNLPPAAPPPVRTGDPKATLSLLHAGLLPALSCCRQHGMFKLGGTLGAFWLNTLFLQVRKLMRRIAQGHKTS